MMFSGVLGTFDFLRDFGSKKNPFPLLSPLTSKSEKSEKKVEFSDAIAISRVDFRTRHRISVLETVRNAIGVDETLSGKKYGFSVDFLYVLDGSYTVYIASMKIF